MAPIKFEEHIKEKLDSREIRPSAGSWEKLNAQLDKNQNSGKNNTWWISSIAAIILLALCGIIYLNMNRSVEDSLVNTPEIRKSSEDSVKEFKNPVQVAATQKTEAFQEKPEVMAKDPNKAASKDARTIGSETQQIASATVIGERTEVLEKVDTTPTLQNSRISEEVDKVLAEVTKLEAEKGEVSDEEVEILLRQAIANMEKKNLQKSKGIPADVLLASVEAEVYESFKEKVFEVVKTGYQKAAVAVSNKLDQSQEK